MAQIIKHRRGSITQLKDVTARISELVVATGSIGDLNGPLLFVGETEGVAGAYRPISKIYQGSIAPTITISSHGSVIDGTPFYASGNKSLYILSKDGNNRLDLTGNIEGNTISGVTIVSLTGSHANITNLTGSTLTSVNGSIVNLTGGTLTVSGTTSLQNNLYITGNTIQTGSIDITGDISLGGNITIGNQTTDIINFGGEVSSSIVPDVHNAFDLGSSSQNWRNLHVSGTAYVNVLEAQSISLDGITVFEDLVVSGSSYLGQGGGDQVIVSGSLYNDALTNNRVVIVGTDGLLEDDANFTFDANVLNVGQGNVEIDVADGDIRTSGSLKVIGASELQGAVGINSTLDVTGSVTLKNTLSVASTSELKGAVGMNSTLDVTGSATLKNTLTVLSTTELKSAVGINSTLDVTGSAQFKNTINVDGEATLASATVEDLTQNRIVAVGAGGSLIDYSGLTYNGTLLQIGGGVVEIDNADGDIRTSGSLTVEGGQTVNGDVVVNGVLTVTGNTQLQSNLYVSGNLEVLGSATNVIIQSQTIELDDNIIRLNAYSPFERYAGFEVIDSGSSGASASMVWDSLNDYWMFVSSSGQSSKMIGTTAGTYGSEVSLTETYFPIATGPNTIGDSLLRYSGTTLSFNTNKFTIDSGTGDTLVSGNFTLSYSGGTDNGNKTSAIMFRNSSNVVGFVSTTETTDVLDGVLGYKNSTGALVFSTVIDGGTY
jgi:hypothetical protein